MSNSTGTPTHPHVNGTGDAPERRSFTYSDLEGLCLAIADLVGILDQSTPDVEEVARRVVKWWREAPLYRFDHHDEITRHKAFVQHRENNPGDKPFVPSRATVIEAAVDYVYSYLKLPLSKGDYPDGKDISLSELDRPIRNILRKLQHRLEPGNRSTAGFAQGLARDDEKKDEFCEYLQDVRAKLADVASARNPSPSPPAGAGGTPAGGDKAEEVSSQQPAANPPGTTAIPTPASPTFSPGVEPEGPLPACKMGLCLGWDDPHKAAAHLKAMERETKAFRQGTGGKPLWLVDGRGLSPKQRKDIQDAVNKAAADRAARAEAKKNRKRSPKTQEGKPTAG